MASQAWQECHLRPVCAEVMSLSCHYHDGRYPTETPATRNQRARQRPEEGHRWSHRVRIALKMIRQQCPQLNNVPGSWRGRLFAVKVTNFVTDKLSDFKGDNNLRFFYFIYVTFVNFPKITQNFYSVHCEDMLST